MGIYPLERTPSPLSRWYLPRIQTKRFYLQGWQLRQVVDHQTTLNKVSCIHNRVVELARKFQFLRQLRRFYCLSVFRSGHRGSGLNASHAESCWICRNIGMRRHYYRAANERFMAAILWVGDRNDNYQSRQVGEVTRAFKLLLVSLGGRLKNKSCGFRTAAVTPSYSILERSFNLNFMNNYAGKYWRK